MRHINKAYIKTLDNSWKSDQTQGLSEEKYLGKLKVNMGDRPGQKTTLKARSSISMTNIKHSSISSLTSINFTLIKKFI